jgi:hypothetical protein
MKMGVDLKCMRCQEKMRVEFRKKPDPYTPVGGRVQCLWCDTLHAYKIMKKQMGGLAVVTQVSVVKEGTFENYSEAEQEKRDQVNAKRIQEVEARKANRAAPE